MRSCISHRCQISVSYLRGVFTVNKEYAQFSKSAHIRILDLAILKLAIMQERSSQQSEGYVVYSSKLGLSVANFFFQNQSISMTDLPSPVKGEFLMFNYARLRTRSIFASYGHLVNLFNVGKDSKFSLINRIRKYSYAFSVPVLL